MLLLLCSVSGKWPPKSDDHVRGFQDSYTWWSWGSPKVWRYRIIRIEFLETLLCKTWKSSWCLVLDHYRFVKVECSIVGLIYFKREAPNINRRWLPDLYMELWRFIHPNFETSQIIRSCEHFLSKGVSVAIPWSNFDTEQNIASFSSGTPTYAQSGACDSERFSLANWFSMDSSAKSWMTWPEEKLPSWDLQERDIRPCNNHGEHHLHQMSQHSHSSRMVSSTWGLVFVTANLDGTIKTFHNYGLPIKI